MADEEAVEIREAVGVFHSAADIESAIEELEENGFDRAEISLLASDEAVRQKLGHRFYGDAEGALLGGLMYVGALAAAGAVVASGGSFGAILAATAVGGGSGGLIGGILAGLVGKHHSDHLQRQLERGGLLLWVRTRDQAHEQRAVDILKRNKALDVHLHTIEA
jgi:hypothetical protein